MKVYRICPAARVATALDGAGAALVGGRWNSVGVRMGYAAASASLAMLELLVHVNRTEVPIGRRLLTFEVPGDAVTMLPRAEWPPGWDALPYGAAVRAAGDAFITAGASLALVVPSAVCRGEFNFLINPRHPRFDEIVLVGDDPLAMDPRLFD